MPEFIVDRFVAMRKPPPVRIRVKFVRSSPASRDQAQAPATPRASNGVRPLRARLSRPDCGRPITNRMSNRADASPPPSGLRGGTVRPERARFRSTNTRVARRRPQALDCVAPAKQRRSAPAPTRHAASARSPQRDLAQFARRDGDVPALGDLREDRDAGANLEVRGRDTHRIRLRQDVGENGQGLSLPHGHGQRDRALPTARTRRPGILPEGDQR